MDRKRGSEGEKPDSLKHRLILLVLGGAKSGKTTYALKRARGLGRSLAYIATAQALDKEMAKAIRRHRRDRGGAFETFEEPLNLGEAVRKASRKHDAVVVDCLTLWVSNLLTVAKKSEKEVERDIRALISALRETDSPVILVSNEVGLGIVPRGTLSRKYRILLGVTNQRVASLANEVVLMVAGIPWPIKGGLEKRGPE